MQNSEIIDVDASNLEQLGFYCYRSKKSSEGYRSKLHWLKQRFDEGMRIKLLYIEGREAGLIEYAPAESAWRVLNAPGYLVVHCLYSMGRYQGKGARTLLLGECLADARAAGKAGVAVVIGKSTFLPDRAVFDRNGFLPVEEQYHDFEILIRPFYGGSMPGFPSDWARRLEPFKEGLHVIHAPQCPYNAAYLDAVRAVGERIGVTTSVVELTSSAELQKRAPTPVGVYALIHDGEVILHHPETEKRLTELLAPLL